MLTRGKINAIETGLIQDVRRAWEYGLDDVDFLIWSESLGEARNTRMQRFHEWADTVMESIYRTH